MAVDDPAPAVLVLSTAVATPLQPAVDLFAPVLEDIGQEEPPSGPPLEAGPLLVPTALNGRPLLEAALAELLPQQPESPHEAENHSGLASTPRVQLGFRDGTCTDLDPTSDQSQLLQQLAQSLTHRD